MIHHIDRRGFVKSVVGASMIPLFLKGTATPSPAANDEDQPRAHIYLERFDYDGVRLLDGMLQKQYLATRDYYFNLPDDDILLGFGGERANQRPGMSSPVCMPKTSVTNSGSG